MGDNNVTLQKTASGTVTIPKAVKYSQSVLKEHYTRRIAIDQAELGSFYDARTDRVLESLVLCEALINENPMYEPVRCNVIEDDTFDNEQLFRIIGVHEELWLSLVLKMASAEGTASLVNSSFSKSKNTRILHYYYLSKLNWIINHQDTVKKNIPKSIPDIAATHVVNSIKSGIEALIILQLPDNEETEHGCLLEKLSKQLITNELDLTQEETILLDRIVVTKVFSNTPEVMTMTTLVDICHTIIALKPHVKSHRTLEYAIRPITWFYPSYSKQKSIFVTFERENMKIIRQYLLPLASKMKELLIPFDLETETILETHFEQQFREIQQDISELKKMYLDEIQRIRVSVLNIREGRLMQDRIAQVLIDNPENLLQNNLDLTAQRLHALIEKAELINNFNQQDIQYLNERDVPIQESDDLKTILKKLIEKRKEKVIFCCTNDLRKRNPLTWKQHYAHFIEEHENNASVHLVYVNFSDSSPHLSKMEIWSHKPSDDNKEQFNLIKSSPSSTVKTTASSMKQPNDMKESFNSSTISKSQITEDASRSEEQPENVQEHVNIPESPTISTLEDPSEKRKNTLNTEERINSPASSISTSAKDTILSKKEPDHKKKQNEPPKSPTLPASKPTPLSAEPRPLVAEPRPLVAEPRPLAAEPTPPTTGICAKPFVSTATKTINVLLLGESGVGKSTFINALVNYLIFDTFQEAHSSEPVVLMPVSFMMTVGDDFKEQIVKWGDEDCNEDHDHPGQSVTQHCRSYVVKLSNQTKLRIIDTPGMGDTRGLDQDDLNMQHILSFISNLPHLNAICILLKPNEARLNIVLRSYFTRLVHFLGTNVGRNIVFCFTNTRATFFAPGNTGPLLKKMISGLPIEGIAYEKRNTYCFDNESFRYLIALQNGIDFDDYQKEEYKRSWITSVKESNRLLQYISAERECYSCDGWQSVEHAQSKISQMIRPILEAIRNTLRNIILIKETTSELLINLIPVVLSAPSTICLVCKFQCKPQRYSEFRILLDDLHTVSDNCTNCRCDRKKHINVDYKLEYELYHSTNTESFTEQNSIFDQLRKAIFALTKFHAYIVQTFKQTDPILPALSRMIEEEKQICSQLDSECINSTLLNELINLKDTYGKKLDDSMLRKEPVNLANVYELIKKVSEIDIVNEQMSIIKQGQERYMKQHEKEISLTCKEK